MILLSVSLIHCSNCLYFTSSVNMLSVNYLTVNGLVVCESVADFSTNLHSLKNIHRISNVVKCELVLRHISNESQSGFHYTVFHKLSVDVDMYFHFIHQWMHAFTVSDIRPHILLLLSSEVFVSVMFSSNCAVDYCKE